MGKKKVMSAGVAIALLGTLLAACGSDASNNDASESPASNSSSDAESSPAASESASGGEKVTLKVVGQKSELNPAIEIYKKNHPNVDVEVIEGGWGPGGKDMREKQLVLISSGQEPDIGKMVWGKEFFRKGILEDITQEVQSWPIYSRYSEAQKDRMTIDGHVFATTDYNSSVLMFYNKDILSKLGVEPPKTIDEVSAIGKKIKEQDLKTDQGKPIYATSFEGGNWFTDYWFWTLGGKQMNDDYTQSLIDSPESVKAYQTMQDFVKNGWAPKIDGSFSQYWLNGQVAVWIDGMWDFTASKDAKLNFGVATVPTGADGKSTVSIGGIEYGIFKASKHKKEALEFLQTMVSPEYEVKANSESFSTPTDPAIYDDSTVIAAWKANGTYEAWMAQKEQLKNTKYNFLEAPFVYQDGSKVYSDAIEKILVRLDDPAQTLKAAAEQINKGIADSSK